MEEKRITIVVPIEVYEAVAKLAQSDRRSLKSEVIVLLEEALAKRNGKGAA